MTEISENVYAAPEVEQQTSGRSIDTAYGCIIVTLLMGLVFLIVLVVGLPIYRDFYPTNPQFKKGEWVKVKGGFYRDQIGQVKSAIQNRYGNWEYGVDPVNSIVDGIAERDLTICEPPFDADAQQHFDWRTYRNPNPRRVQ